MALPSERGCGSDPLRGLVIAGRRVVPERSSGEGGGQFNDREYARFVGLRSLVLYV